MQETLTSSAAKPSRLPTTAWWFRALVLALLAATLAWLVGFGLRGQWLVALAGVAVLVGLHVGALVVEFVSLWRCTRGLSAPERPTLEQLFKALVAESWVLVRPFALDLPMWQGPRALDPDHALARHAGQRGVVLVHGLFCNHALWNPWLRRLRKLDVPHVAVTLDPPLADLEVQARLIGPAVERLRQATGMAPLILTHSMGGVVARAWLRQQRSGLNTGPWIDALVTVAAPHAGSRVAAKVSRWWAAKALLQISEGSSWLDELAASETTAQRSRWVCFYAQCDNVVVPTDSATLPGADNRMVMATAHTQLLGSPQVFDAVIQRLKAVPTADRHAASR
jgi:triacylglycerol lipase